MGVEQLAGLLGPNSIRLLELLNERSITGSASRNWCCRNSDRNTYFMIALRDRRFFCALKLDDAMRFARLLSFESVSDPFGVLSSVDFRNGTLPFRVLLAFFGVTQAEAQAQELPGTREMVRPAYPLFDHQRRAGRAVYPHLAGSTLLASFCTCRPARAKPGRRCTSFSFPPTPVRSMTTL